MNDKTVFKKISAGLEWIDENYDGLDETAKHAMDEFTQGVVVLLGKYGYTKGSAIGSAVIAPVVAFTTALAGSAIYDKLKKWRENRLNKTETTDSE